MDPIDRTGGGWRALAVVTAPLVMLAALATHPYLERLPDAAAVAALVEADTTRWAVAHVLTVVGSALVAVAFVAIDAHLRDAGEARFSGWGLPLVVIGSVLYGFLPGLEFAPLAAVEAGGDALAIQSAVESVLIPMLVVSNLTFATGVVGVSRDLAASRVAPRGTTRFVIIALAVMALARFVPLGAVQFYVQAAAAPLAFLPLAHAMWKRPRVRATAGTPVGPANVTDTVPTRGGGRSRGAARRAARASGGR